MATARFKSKFLAALLAFVAGGFGAHRLYLGTRGAWAYPAWLVAGMLAASRFGTEATTWIIVVFAALPVWIGFAESLGYAVQADERFDALHNARVARRNRNGWNCVLLAIVVLLVGTFVLMTTIIFASQGWYEAQGFSFDR